MVSVLEPVKVLFSGGSYYGGRRISINHRRPERRDPGWTGAPRAMDLRAKNTPEACGVRVASRTMSLTMKPTRSLRRLLRKAARWIGPATSTTALHGCPCPSPVEVADQPYTSSITVTITPANPGASSGEMITLDATAASWQAFCEKQCGAPATSCLIEVGTCDCSGQPINILCGSGTTYGQMFSGALRADWVPMCQGACGEEQDCSIGVGDDPNGKPIIRCESWWTNCGGGRRTDGSPKPEAFAASKVGLGLAQMAAREAQSIPAFSRLARELRAYGAPRKLIKRAGRSRRDEMRHTRVITALARRFGGVVTRPESGPVELDVRPLYDFALENAVEGCVRETYGSIVARSQATEARDIEIRGVMRRIAGDEARHGALAWEVHRWAMKRLPKESQRAIERAMEQAIFALSSVR